jgi:hypothetical protein
MCKKVLEPRRRREPVGNHERAQVDELLRNNRWLLRGDDDPSGEVTLLANDGKK